MVLPLLLSDGSTPLRYGDLARTVLQCLHELHCMERALSIFHGVLTHGDCEDFSPPPSSPFQSLSAFDAHVGDCACQTRAQMFWDLVKLYNTVENKAILLYAMMYLKKVKANTALLLEEIELSHGKPRNPKLNVLVNHMAFWKRIGFHAFLELTVRDSSSDSQPVSKAGRQRSGHRRRDLTVDADWDPCDFVSVARLLTTCNLLSEFKIASIEAGPPTRVRVRVDLRSMYERNARELEDLKLTERKLNYRIKANERMTRQTEAMQIYVSNVTTDWAKQTAIKDSVFWPSFPEDFIATSDRRITCVPSYVSLLLLRDTWMKLDIPIFAMIQHFCSHGGYRNIYCRIVKNHKAVMSKDKNYTLGEGDWFKTEELSLDEVIPSKWGRLPHIILIGMSCRGTIDDFKMRLLESQRGLLPLQHRCGESQDCARAMTRTNISQLLTHFFAQHEQFPFILPSPEDEFERVAAGLRSCLGKEAEAAFAEARLGADLFGTGRSTRLATLEHIFLEYPSVLARDIEDYGERPRVLGCKLK